MKTKLRLLGVLLIAFTLLSSVHYVFAGFTGDIPAIRFEKESNDDKMLTNVVLEEVTVNRGIAKVAQVDPKDTGVRFVWQTSASFSDKSGWISQVDPKDEGVAQVDPKDQGAQGKVVCEPIVLLVPSVKAGEIKGKLEVGTVDYVVTLRLVMILPNGREKVMDEVQIKGSI